MTTLPTLAADSGRVLWGDRTDVEDGRDTPVSELPGGLLLVLRRQQAHLAGRAQFIHMFWAEDNKHKIILSTKTGTRRHPRESTT